VFKDIANRIKRPLGSQINSDGIDELALFEYSMLPGILADRFFDVMSDHSNKPFITQDQFVNGILTILNGSESE
jgi:hypothetical protein